MGLSSDSLIPSVVFFLIATVAGADWGTDWCAPPWVTTSVNLRPCTTSKVVSTPGTYTITLVPETCTTATVSSGPTTISYPETTIMCPTNGIYTATLTPEVRTTMYIEPPAKDYTTVYIDTTITKTYMITTTSCSTHRLPTLTTDTSQWPEPSWDMDYEDQGHNKAREVHGSALKHRPLPNNIFRRGGVIRSKRSAEEEKAAPARKRDFGIPKRGLLGAQGNN